MEAAENRSVATASGRAGDLETRFDAAGNLTEMLARRDGACLPQGASCWQRFRYGWDELGRLDRARRWDLQGDERASTLEESLPARPADVDLRSTYNCGDARVLKTATDGAGNQSHTVYINENYELRRTWWADGDYVVNPDTVTVRLPGAVVVYSAEDLPSLTSGRQHLFLQLTDYLRSSTATIDRSTGELVELSSYQPYGAIESDYRPARWGEFRESYKFSGKEEDIEVGLTYFGARFLVGGLSRWASPDPVTIHHLRGDANPYAYVGGRPFTAVDPDGREILTVIAVAAVYGAIVGGATSAVVQQATTGRVDWGWKGVAGAALAGAVSGGVSGGLGAAGAGMWAGAIGQGAGAGVGAAVNGQGFWGVAGATVLGGVVGIGGSWAQSKVSDALIGVLEPTGVSLATAMHLSSAASGVVVGAGTGMLTELAMASFVPSYKADYGRAAGVGATSAVAAYLGAAVTGQIHTPKAYDTADDAGIAAALRNQIDANATGLETGSLIYEWGGSFYSTQGVRSDASDSIAWEGGMDDAWKPMGAREVGYHHSHPPWPEGMAALDGFARHLVPTAKGTAEERGGIYEHDANVAYARGAFVNARFEYTSYISTHYGYLDIYRVTPAHTYTLQSLYIGALRYSQMNPSFLQMATQ
ncbi:MAG TPA: RHS repeat-associated core domain-containing protein [Polyangiaceae bacterium]|nr:RHS repeat-associated core domain-containing protein [Polyangiaceae bacterium]